VLQDHPELPDQLGSAYRAGREDPAYQSSRLRMLADFAARMAAAHAGALREAERRAAEVWRGHTWLEEQRENWMRIAEERERIINELRDWIQQLEATRKQLEEQWNHWMAVAEQRENRIRELEETILQLRARLGERGDEGRG